MKASEEALYATYSMMLKQGFELSTKYVTRNWGILAEILPMYQYGFARIHYPHLMNRLALGVFKISLLIIAEGKALKLEIKKTAHFKILTGNLALYINNININKEYLLVSGDEFAVQAGDCGQLVSHNGPAVVLQLVID
ncbi:MULTISPECIES: hypothetical protein [Olivibacter]|uniref:Quercetin 2,3-dioxygenase C-terminal cupin domain-containing protein n=1 Tax=Olivibacter jilunii TaxID=985016 RepID=A0ABW6B8V1_9SPHI